MKILVINSGSSSIKCTLFEMPQQRALADATVDKIGEAVPPGGNSGNSAGMLRLKVGEMSVSHPCAAQTHEEALDALLDCLLKEGGGVLESLDQIAAVGHRVVHGGEKIADSVAVDDEVIAVIEENSKLAPLHNPPNLVGLRAALERLEGKLQVAVFDTAFHRSVPPEAYLYAVPFDLYEQHGVRRYGFHGTSHRYVAERAAQMLSKAPEECNLITLHLGNGCSAAAVRGGRSIDTSMGLTPLEGLVMGTRCGDIDPALPFFFVERLGMSEQEVYDLLNRRSGLAGLSGVGNDMREIIAAARDGNKRAELALSVFCYRVKKYIGAYYAVLGRLNGIVFTAGIGENSPEVRRRCLEGLEPLGIVLDEKRNVEAVGCQAIISADDSPVSVCVVPTDEALEIAIDTYGVYVGGSDRERQEKR